MFFKHKAEVTFLRELLDKMPVSVFWKNKKGVYLGCSAIGAKLAGFNSPQDVVGKTIFDLFPKEIATSVEKIDQGVMQTKLPFISEEKGLNTQGEPADYWSIKIPLDHKGKVSGLLGVSLDISELKKTQAEKERALKQANKANHLITQFIQNMQHDIRTPSSGVLSLLTHLAGTETNEERKKLLKMGQDSAKQLFDLCNEIIDFDQIERGHEPLHSKKFNVSHLVNGVVALNQAAAHAKGLVLRTDNLENIPHVVKGDDYRLKRILINLVGNAIKFTQRGEICVVSRVVKETEKNLIIEFEVRDTGIGIPLEKKEQIYEKFIRLDPANRAQYKGSGLGLQIVKQFVSELEGEIEVQSELGKGTQFFISLPFEKPLHNQIHDAPLFDPVRALGVMPPQDETLTHAHAHIAVAPLSKEAASCDVFLIEDDPLAARVEQFILHHQGCAVTQVMTVQDSLKLLAEKKFDWILSDLGLPDGTGCDIVRAIKNEPTHLNFNTPFFAITAHTDDEKKQEAKDAGFLMTFPKPLTSKAVIQLMKMTTYSLPA